TEAGAVALNLKDGVALATALERMRGELAAYAPNVAFDQLLLESMATPPLAELIVGIKRENDFGLALVIGAGGILVELLKDSRSL
ncbi:acetate--CoA ligase family protein, partial [Escherichia coli]|uniref:acetate--CoA ligase family protein n=2 Tax=Gammaproteobacteria TaxID=1236 RepID=UPI00273A4FD1